MEKVRRRRHAEARKTSENEKRTLNIKVVKADLINYITDACFWKKALPLSMTEADDT